MNAPEGTLISYATQPGNVAQDGTDGDSPYTKALVQTIAPPGLGIFDVFNEVKRSTGGSQQPWVSSSPIDGSFYFAPANLSSDQPRNPENFGSSEAAQAWSAAKDTTNVAVLESFIQRYKETFYADLARARLNDLRRPTNQSPQVAAVPSSADQKSKLPNLAPRQRALLYDEDPSNPKGKQYVGSVVWSIENIGKDKGGLVIRADVDVPDRKFKMTLWLRRNTDSTVPASHIVELNFALAPGFADGGVSSVPGLLTKHSEKSVGTPLAGLAALAVKVTDGFFVVGLSNVDAERMRNLQLLRECAWFDMPMIYANQRRAILAIEKGTFGEQIFANAFSAWGEIQSPPSRQQAAPAATSTPSTSPSAAPAAVLPPPVAKRPQTAQPSNRPLTMQECAEKYKAARDAGALGGQIWNDFRHTQCGGTPEAPTVPPVASDTKPLLAKKQTAPDAAPAAGGVVFPGTVDPKYASETPGKARMYTCVDQYNANKATDSNGGLKWIQQGGGYYSACNQKLKGW